MIFENLKIIDPILKAINELGYTSPTPIQEQCIPDLLEGKDLEGCAQTGTGKTAAFAIPILQLLHSKIPEKKSRVIKALILAPTRELALQISESFTSYGKYTGLKNTVIFGGVSQGAQVNKLRSGIDILVATPGRLLDLMQQKYISLQDVEFFVLDEADRMLDMGLGRDVKRIISKLPKERQTMLFSATMPKEIEDLMDDILIEPVKVKVTPVSSTVGTINQAVYFVDKRNKKSLLLHILKDKSFESVLVFSRTKHGANIITDNLVKMGVEAQAIHGNKSQNARQLALNNFKEKKIRVLVATDIAARGIDVEDLSLVINYDLPDVPETYVHRIGRTGRAGADGTAFSFCDGEDRQYLRNIEKIISKAIPVIEEHPYLSSLSSMELNNSDAAKKRDFKKKAYGTKSQRNSYARKSKQSS